MTAVTPLLFQLTAAQDQSIPPLQQVPYVQGFEEYLNLGELGFLDLPGVSQFYPVREALRPRPLLEAAARGGPSVPILTEDELGVLLSGAEPLGLGAVHRPARYWWDLYATASGHYALFPGDDDPEPTLPLGFLVPNALSAELRRIDLPALFGLRWGGQGRATVPAEACGLDLEHDEEGAPYRGRCRRRGCPNPCSTLVVVTPDTGHYRLEGCRCAD